jgi:hypothetical protein
MLLPETTNLNLLSTCLLAEGKDGRKGLPLMLWINSTSMLDKARRAIEHTVSANGMDLSEVNLRTLSAEMLEELEIPNSQWRDASDLYRGGLRREYLDALQSKPLIVLGYKGYYEGLQTVMTRFLHLDLKSEDFERPGKPSTLNSKSAKQKEKTVADTFQILKKYIQDNPKAFSIPRTYPYSEDYEELMVTVRSLDLAARAIAACKLDQRNPRELLRYSLPEKDINAILSFLEKEEHAIEL